ncbi:MAG: hypothetical protein ACLFVT_01870, partial [Syntrophobacteria bacterium]
VDLNDLCTFFHNPARFLLKGRLGMYLEQRGSILEETESFEITGLEKYLLEKILVERKFAGCDPRDFLPAARASGLLPHGAVGECVYENLSRGVETFVARAEPYMRGESREPLEVNLAVSGFTLMGRLEAVSAEQLLHYRYARAKSSDHLRVWLYHLALNCLEAPHYPRTTRFAALHPRDARPWLWEYAPVKKSRDILGELLELYWRGLIRPLHFFPESSAQYATQYLAKGKSPEEALVGASSTWRGSDYTFAEREDPYYQLCFGQTDPLDAKFQELAAAIFRPLLSHRKDRAM